MSSEAALPTDRLNILLDNIELPENQETRDAIVDDLQTAIQSVLAQHDCPVEQSRIVEGHTYTTIEASCPTCRDPLKLFEIEADSENGAFASATCECGWRGSAVYRLIDLQEALSSNPEDDEWWEDIWENSSVRAKDSFPTYIPY